MMAPRTNGRRRISPATTWLIRAFSPGCPTYLRSWESKPIRTEGERCEALTIFFDLPDDPAFRRALELAASAGTLRLIRVGKTIVRELSADVSGPQRTLVVEALLGLDAGADGDAK
jgi:hypothetical protein